jgi:hypothetical protein
MAKIPEPRAGLVFRYRYLRIWQYERGDQVGKDRPCCVLLPLKAGQAITGNPIHHEVSTAPVERYIAEDGDVLILLIQSDEPGVDQIGLELTVDDKRYVGLPSDAPSYIIVSEVNVDKWPNGDMSLVPGRQNSFVYDRPLAGPVLARVLTAFLMVQQARKVRVLVRHP